MPDRKGGARKGASRRSKPPAKAAPESVPESAAFLNSIFGAELGELRIQLWHKESKRSHYPGELKKAATIAAENPVDLYVAASLAPKGINIWRRATAQQAAGIGGMWADIDVNGGPEDKRGAAPDRETATELAQSILEPTILVDSGYGLQAWWLFEAPWIFDSKADRQSAANTIEGWQSRLRARAEEMGFRIDSTFDLARLMRLPGTFNGKGEKPRPVIWIDEDDEGPRYEIEQMIEEAKAGEIGRAALVAPVAPLVIDANASPPLDLLEAAIENMSTFEQTWKRTRRGKEYEAWSGSEWDMALANQAVALNWTDQQICDLLIAHRRKHKEQKVKGVNYFQRTIARARTARHVDSEERRREEAYEELEGLSASSETPQPDRTLHLFNEVLPPRCPDVTEVYQDGTNAETARFTLVLEDGTELLVGSAGSLLEQGAFRKVLFTSCQVTLKPVKAARWLAALDALISVATVRDTPDNTPEGRTLEWLRNYLEMQMTEDKDEAVPNREPFEEEGFVYVFAERFATFVRNTTRQPLTTADLRATMRSIGFEHKRITYHAAGKQTSTSYWRAPKEIL